MEQLKLDRRLVRRKNWISREELEKELDALPDVSHKIASDDHTSGAESSEAEGPGTDHGSAMPSSQA